MPYITARKICEYEVVCIHVFGSRGVNELDEIHVLSRLLRNDAQSAYNIRCYTTFTLWVSGFLLK